MSTLLNFHTSYMAKNKHLQKARGVQNRELFHECTSFSGMNILLDTNCCTRPILTAFHIFSRSLSFSTVHVSDKPFIPPRTFFPSKHPSSEITHSTHNGVCSYHLSTERPRTHICSRIPQTINNSLLMFKSHFSDKVLTIKRNKLRPTKGAALAVLET